MKAKRELAQQLSKQVEMLAKSSPHFRHPKQVLEEVFKLGFRTLAHPGLFLKCWPLGYIRGHGPYAGEAHPDHLALFEIVQTYVALVAAAEPFEDVLTQEYDAYLGEVLGQYCTPNDVAQLMGALGLVDAKISKAFNTRTHQSLFDVCSGAGSLTMGKLHQVYQSYGRDGVALLDITCEDIDPHMCMLTGLQLTMSALVHAVPFSSLSIRCVNTLTQKDPVQALYVLPDAPRYFRTHQPSPTDLSELQIARGRQSAPWEQLREAA